MSKKGGFGILTATVLVGGVLWQVAETQQPPTEADRRPRSREALTLDKSPQGTGLASSTSETTPSSPQPSEVGQPRQREPAGRRRAFDRQRADAVRQRAAQRIAARKARKRAPKTPGASVAPPAVPVASPEDKRRGREYIGNTVREQYFPIARSCYDELLERNPMASGKIVLAFSIVGDGEDGVVSEVELKDDTTMDDAEFILCMRESMYTTVFEAPPADVEETTIVFPIDLAPGPPEDESVPPTTKRRSKASG